MPKGGLHHIHTTAAPSADFYVKLTYNDFAKIAYEEGINVNPGNRALLRNYLLFLLEIKELDKF
jgi:Tfp pilus assembly protein PilF